jgi:hypothetical protein
VGKLTTTPERFDCSDTDKTMNKACAPVILGLAFSFQIYKFADIS